MLAVGKWRLPLKSVFDPPTMVVMNAPEGKSGARGALRAARKILEPSTAWRRGGMGVGGGRAWRKPPGLVAVRIGHPMI